jgi:biotin transport system ATP-binding protein
MTDAASARVGRAGGPVAGGLAQTIEFRAVSLVRDGRAALDGIDLRLTQARVGIVGLNGSGKSTLLKSIIGLVAPTVGTITVDGRDSVSEARAVRADTGFLFQNPDSQIVFPIVAEDLAFGLKNHGFSKVETADRVAQALDRLGIARLSRRRIHELSGGEKQLVALAGVLAIEPKTVLFDEPTSQLDLKNRNRFRDALAALPEQAIVVAHDLDLLADFDRVVVIEAGRIVHDGAAAEALDAYREICR